ncbi:uncharacterized protein LOC131011017 [Salvia miltiorrhiza]|uniref:uncharacterized protein LOC131011017 n=1 Tax=Salvia miltiorrhiza TaxID=226208 RepID=UPI0025AD043E|nr:uncharacterized protein LOC131011017 [Salvia miltiorrhiza]
MARTKNARGPKTPKNSTITPEAIINNAHSSKRTRGQAVKVSPVKRLECLPPSESNIQTYLNFPTKLLKDRYSVISQCDILQGRSLDVSTLETLRIRKEVEDLIEQIGWKSFFHNDCPAFIELTREFYTTFEFDTPADLSLDTPGVIRYRLMGYDIEESITDFNLSLGAISKDDLHVDWYINSKVGYGDFVPNHVWVDMAVGKTTYDPSQSPSTLLKKPEWQYLHRLLSFNYIARKSGTTTCSKVELYVIWAMVNSVKLNLGYWLALQIKKVLEKRKGLILGSMITRLAISHGLLDLENHSLHKAHDNKPLDEKSLIRMGIVEKKDGVLKFVPPSTPMPPVELHRQIKRARLEKSDILDNLDAPDQSSLDQSASNTTGSDVMQMVDGIVVELRQKIDDVAKDLLKKFDEIAKDMMLKVEEIAVVQAEMQSDLKAEIRFY